MRLPTRYTRPPRSWTSTNTHWPLRARTTARRSSPSWRSASPSSRDDNRPPTRGGAKLSRKMERDLSQKDARAFTAERAIGHALEPLGDDRDVWLLPRTHARGREGHED